MRWNAHTNGQTDESIHRMWRNWGRGFPSSEGGTRETKLKIFRLSTCFSIIGRMADAAVLGFRETKALRRGQGREGSAVVKLKAAENLLEQADDERGEGGKRLQPPMVAQRLVRMVG